MSRGSRSDLEKAAALLRRGVDTDIEILRAAWAPALALVLHLLGDPEALELAARALERAELPDATAISVCALALELAARGDATAARHEMGSAMPDVRRCNTMLQSTVLISAAGVAIYGDDHPRAARWLASASAIGAIFSSPYGVMLYRQFVPLVRAALPSEEAHTLRAEGRLLPLGDALDELTDWVTEISQPGKLV